MGVDSDNIAQWAGAQGYSFKPDTEDLLTAEAKKLDTFGNWDSAANHVSGQKLGRSFEMIDLTKYFSGGSDGSKRTHQTVVLLPNVAAGLPDFEVVPRRVSFAVELLGHKALSLTAPPHGQHYERELVTAFNKQARLYPGGILESAAAAANTPGLVSPAIGRIASICTRPVFEFLVKHPDWYIELQNGHLAAWTPDRVLDRDERDAGLSAVFTLLDLLLDAEHATPIVDASQQTTFNRARVWGILAGAGIGFFFGTFTAVGLSFTNQKLILLVPVLALIGLAVGGVIGGTVGQLLFGRR